MMHIEEIELQYFLGFGEKQKIDLRNTDVIGIVGTYEGATDKSNRAGKTSLLEAILYNLYGKCRAKKEMDVINWNYKDVDMYTKITYNFDGKQVIITRGRTAGNDLILDVTGLEGERKKEIQPEINKLVGCDYDDFIKLNFFLQNDVHNFVKSGSTEMSKLLSKWINTDYWEQYRKRADALVKQVEESIKELQAYNKANDISLESIRKASESKKDIEEGIEKLKDELSVLKGYQKDKEAHDEMLEEIEELESKIEKCDKKIGKLKSKIEGYKEDLVSVEENKKKLSKFEKQLKKVSKFTKEDLKAISEKIKINVRETSSITDKLEAITKKEKRINEGEIICPITEEACGFIKGDNKKNMLSELKSEKLDLALQLQTLEGEYKVLEDRQSSVEEALEDSKRIEIKIARLDTDDSEILENIKELEEEIEELNSEKVKIKKKIKILNSKIDDFADRVELQEFDSGEIDEKEEEIQDQMKLIGEYTKQIKDGNRILKTVRENKKKIIQYQKKLKHLKFCSFMFGKRGIPNNQIEGAFAEVEADANFILKSKFKTDIQIEFKNYKELQEKESTCSVCGFVYPKGYRKSECEECGSIRGKKRRDELNLKMIVGGKEVDFESDSGAGQVMVSLAIRIALIRMLMRRANVGCSLLFLDEIFAMLDAVNRKNTMQLVFDTLMNEFGYNQIFCISHHEDVSRMIKRNILVTKFNKFSKFEWM